MFEIGSSLREARARQGLDFNEMEMRTKVRAKYLRALEEEQFETLPAHTYIKGFLRTYAEALGLDGQMYVDEYNSRFVAGEEETPLRTRRVSPAARHRRRERRESHVVLFALMAIGVVTALVIAAWKFGGPDEQSVQGLTPREPAVTVPKTAAATGKARRATLEVRAVKGDSFMEVRVGTRTGRPLYSGTLERGQTQRFVQRSLYVSVASPGNVMLKLNGNRVKLPAGGEYAVTPSGVAAAGGS